MHIVHSMLIIFLHYWLNNSCVFMGCCSVVAVGSVSFQSYWTSWSLVLEDPLHGAAVPVLTSAPVTAKLRWGPGRPGCGVHDGGSYHRHCCFRHCRCVPQPCCGAGEPRSSHRHPRTHYYSMLRQQPPDWPLAEVLPLLVTAEVLQLGVFSRLPPQTMIAGDCGDPVAPRGGDSSWSPAASLSLQPLRSS